MGGSSLRKVNINRVRVDYTPQKIISLSAKQNPVQALVICFHSMNCSIVSKNPQSIQRSFMVLQDPLLKSTWVERIISIDVCAAKVDDVWSVFIDKLVWMAPAGCELRSTPDWPSLWRLAAGLNLDLLFHLIRERPKHFYWCNGNAKLHCRRVCLVQIVLWQWRQIDITLYNAGMCAGVWLCSE